MIGDEYDKKRKAVLKHTYSDVSRTSEILDKDAERSLLMIYREYILDNSVHPPLWWKLGSNVSFYEIIGTAVSDDWMEIDHEYITILKFVYREMKMAHGLPKTSEQITTKGQQERYMKTRMVLTRRQKNRIQLLLWS